MSELTSRKHLLKCSRGLHNIKGERTTVCLGLREAPCSKVQARENTGISLQKVRVPTAENSVRNQEVGPVNECAERIR